MFKTFSHFSEYAFKTQQSLCIPVNYCKSRISKGYSTKGFIGGRGILEIVVTNRNWYKNVQETSFSESATNGKKTEKSNFKC